MRSHIPFDTLLYSKKLIEAGMDAKVAEELSEMNAQILGSMLDDQLAKKRDFKDFRVETKNHIQEIKQGLRDLRHEAKQDLYNLEKRLYTFIVKAIAWTIGIIGSIQTALHFIK